MALSEKLVEFTDRAKILQKEYLQAFLEKKDHKTIVIPITKSEEDAQGNIANKSEAELKRHIFQMMDQLHEVNKKLQEEYFRKSVQNKNLADYVAFYYQIKNDLE